MYHNTRKFMLIAYTRLNPFASEPFRSNKRGSTFWRVRYNSIMQVSGEAGGGGERPRNEDEVRP